MAAGPLLLVSLTDDAFPVSLAALLTWVPPLVFGLHAGVVSDRLDRCVVMVAANLARAAVIGVLATAIITDTVTTVGRCWPSGSLVSSPPSGRS